MSKRVSDVIRKLKPSWETYDARPTWSVLTSRELADVLGVCHQSVSNFKMRGFLPAPVKHPSLKENYNFFRISEIRAWLEDTTEEAVHWAWVKRRLPEQEPQFGSLYEVEYLIKHCWDIIGVEKSRLPLPENQFIGKPRNNI